MTGSPNNEVIVTGVAFVPAIIGVASVAEKDWLPPQRKTSKIIAANVAGKINFNLVFMFFYFLINGGYNFTTFTLLMSASFKFFEHRWRAARYPGSKPSTPARPPCRGSNSCLRCSRFNVYRARFRIADDARLVRIVQKQQRAGDWQFHRLAEQSHDARIVRQAKMSRQRKPISSRR